MIWVDISLFRVEMSALFSWCLIRGTEHDWYRDSRLQRTISFQCQRYQIITIVRWSLFSLSSQVWRLFFKWIFTQLHHALPIRNKDMRRSFIHWWESSQRRLMCDKSWYTLWIADRKSYCCSLKWKLHWSRSGAAEQFLWIFGVLSTHRTSVPSTANNDNHCYTSVGHFFYL